MNVGELMKKYQGLAGKPLDEDPSVTVINDPCVTDRKERLELATKDMRFSEVREEILSSIERRRDTFRGPRPMEWTIVKTKRPARDLGQKVHLGNEKRKEEKRA